MHLQLFVQYKERQRHGKQRNKVKKNTGASRANQLHAANEKYLR
jgi:hypothetical protein